MRSQCLRDDRSAPGEGGHQRDLRPLMDLLIELPLNPVDQDCKGQPARRAQSVDYITGAAPGGKLERGVARPPREIASHRSKPTNCYLHRSILPPRNRCFRTDCVRRGPPYFSISTPTRLPYSVQEPS